MKKKIIIPKIILILSLISILILWPITILSSNSNIWFLLQKRNNVIFSLGGENVKIYNKQIVSFFKGNVRDLNFLTAEEFSHMKDVKNILTKIDLIFWSSLIVFSLSILYLRKSAKKILRIVPLSIISFLVLLLVLSVFNFSSIFEKFHEVFFVGNYSFPSGSMLKILYPDIFFRNIFIVYFILSILGCLVTIAVSYKLKV